MTGTILITGATAGIGAAAARKFVAEGWRAVVTGRRVDRLKALQQELGEGSVCALPLDVTSEEAVQAFPSLIPSEFRGIDVLLNNAGLAIGSDRAQEADLASWKTVIDTNVVGLVSITRQLLPTLIDRKGLILNLSSVAATYPYAGGNVYGATKAFVRQFSLGLRADLHGTGVRVTSIEPGLVETEFTLVRNGGNQDASDALYRGANVMSADDLAETLFWVATQPPHINFNAIELMPVSQSFAGFQVAREPS